MRTNAKLCHTNQVDNKRIYEPRCEKTGLRGFQPGPTQTGLYSYRRWLEAWNFRLRKKRDCTIPQTGQMARGLKFRI